jgi:hypothetical protein
MHVVRSDQGWTLSRSRIRRSERSQAEAASAPAKRCTITQSTCTGGLGGMTLCSTKPGNSAAAALIALCQRANSSAIPSRTRVCVTTVTGPACANVRSLSVICSLTLGR